MDELKTSFFANVTHELRTPLTLILSPVNALLEKQYGDLSQAHVDILNVVERNARRLQLLIDELLDIAKLDANKMEIHEVSVGFKSLVQRIFLAFKSAAEMKSIAYTLDYKASEDLILSLDAKKLEIILNNLLSNALKFTTDGDRISCTVKESENSILLEITDTGRGIPSEDLPHVFDRFYQSTDPRITQEGGTGIGLSLTQEYVQLMKGTIEVTSTFGEWTTFKITLPKHKSDQEPINLHTDTAILQKSSLPKVTTDKNLAKSKPKILVVEDNPDMQRYITSLFSNEYDVKSAVNGVQALEELQNSAPPNLIISDVMMPEMDGFQLLENIKQSELYSTIPVIMLTARVGEKEKLTALRIGVDDYLTKPFSSEELSIRVSNLLMNLKNRSVDLESSSLINEDGSSPKTFTENEQQWLAKIESILLRELTNKHFKMSNLADELLISQSKLSRQIKALTGLTPNKYLLEIRLHKARKHLESKDFQTVSEVSYAIGFEDPNYFSRVFEERFGKRPRAYFK